MDQLVQVRNARVALGTGPRLWHLRAMSPTGLTTTPGQSGADIARAWFESSPFALLLGLRLVSMDADEAVVEMPYRADLATAGDVVHGGAIGALLDSAAALAAWSAHDPADGVKWGTIGLSTSFLAAARGVTLRAHARVTHRGRSICHCRVGVADTDGRAVAEALVTYRLG
jgi:uncharacterized protein (TIGR00369 family)